MHTDWTAQQVSDVVFYGALGAVLGGRIGYVFFYGFKQFLADPVWLLRIWDGGMSFHGGLLGVMVALACCLRVRRTDVPAGQRLRGAVGAAWAGLRPARQFCEHGIARAHDRLAIRGDLSVPRRCDPRDESAVHRVMGRLRAASVAAVSGVRRRRRVVRDRMAVFVEAARRRARCRVCSLLSYGMLRVITEFFREPDVQLGFIALELADDGPAAVDPDDRYLVSSCWSSPAGNPREAISRSDAAHPRARCRTRRSHRHRHAERVRPPDALRSERRVFRW